MTSRYTPEQMDTAAAAIELLGLGQDECFAAMLRQAAADARRVCTTCCYRKHVYQTMPLAICMLSEQQAGAVSYVPLTVDGEPFGCVGWRAKDVP